MGLIVLLLAVVHWALVILLVMLFLRALLSWATVLVRDWEPTGAVRVLAEFVLTVTDPPVRFLERFLPPLKLGGLTVSTATTVLWIAVAFLLTVLP
ncbi:MAG: YggT family protein [Actinobacteria bacterium]|nr:YggT family protein [Actinomycetota bacterium]